MKKNKPSSVALLITTYNWKEALELVLLSVFKQTVLPDEIVIADDGSRSDTKELIDRMRVDSPVPITHVWQEDKGFRLSKIRNKGIAAAKNEYIIQIDGDCVLEKHFVQDHLQMAQSGTYVCGSRTCCSNEFSENWFVTKQFSWWKFRPVKGSGLNRFRVGFLRKYVMPKFPITIKGCNMAFWRADIIAVNGYDENYEGWGYEDHDMAIRLDNLGIKQRTLKMGAVMYHLYHREKNNDLLSDEYHKRMEKLTLLREKNIITTQNGLDKYLPT
ncbi:MAG: glycosyltransferase family 2 protein [Bacteroidia bacterium]|nr:glycosyltransferase family 2 protein [Bacteroidia bacterium]